MTKVNFYDSIDDSMLKFAVIIAKHNGKWVFCKHRERSTWEVPGGHREQSKLGKRINEVRKSRGLTADKLSELRCARSPGRHGQSRSWSATSRSCTLVPAPILAVLPSKTRTWPVRTLANSSFFLTSVLASWIKAI